MVPDETGYSLREKVFFSGLLIFEMYDTLKQVENLYKLGKIPEPARKELERNRKRGYGVDDIGRKGEYQYLLKANFAVKWEFRSIMQT